MDFGIIKRVREKRITDFFFDTKKRYVCLCDVILPYSTRGLAKLSSFLRNDSSFMEKIRTNDFSKVGTHPVQGLGRGVVLGERSFPEK